ncbi:RDD family protein [Alteromonadaceae bacterium BrNp21-10]|nr:RDD family protein [Alteromonadaceae bacterium BrNp21-10]
MPKQADVLDSGLTREESKQIVTPYAFGVADELIGTPLASPTRRAIALVIDLGLIALLTTVNSLVLALISAWAFWRASSKLQHKKRFDFFRKLLRFIGTILLFVVAVGLFEMLNDDDGGDNGGKWNPLNDQSASSEPQSLATGIGIAAMSVKYLMQADKIQQTIDNGECPSAYDCWLPLSKKLAQDLAHQPISTTKATDVFKEIVEGMKEDLTEEQRQQLLTQMQLHYTDAKTEVSATTKTVDEGKELAEAERDTKPQITENKSVIPLNEDGNPSLLAWLQGIVSDLGIGFGWAALYFTAFTSWWKGQTPGKKLLGIRVVKLDGHMMTTWESFERYGGYGAGIATGMLGFLQIYWDLNRQAIHDKISETLVIKGDFDISLKQMSSIEPDLIEQQKTLEEPNEQA